MTAPFDKKYTEHFIVACSLIPTVVQILLCDVGIVMPCINWIVAGVFAKMIWNIVEENHLGLFDRNHAISISWAIISIIINFALVHFNEYEESQTDLFQIAGFIFILILSLKSWQIKVATIHYIICGLIVGMLSVFLSSYLIWLLLFPIIFYHMRTSTKPNWGSLFTGVFLAIWLTYVFRLLVLGESDADGFILSYADIYKDFLPSGLHYNLWEWGMTLTVAIFLVAYSISGYTLSVAKTIKAEASIIMLSTLSLISVVFAIIDYSHLPNYLGIFSVFISLQITIHQSCIENVKNDIWTIIVLVLFALISILSLILPAF